MRSHHLLQDGRTGFRFPPGFGARPEFMILIAIIGIVLAVGLPLLADWRKADQIRAGVADGIARIRPLRDQIARFAERTNRFPTRQDELDLAGFRIFDGVSPDHLDRIRKRKPLPVAELAAGGAESPMLLVRIEPTGELAATLTLPLHEYPRLTYLPTLAAGRVSWTCTSEGFKPKYVPADCPAK